jgi:dihydrofolate reductase
VLSHEELEVPEGVINVHGIDEAIEIAGDIDERIFVIGGASVYEQFLDRADAMILSELHESFEGDTRFPDWDEQDWVEVNRDERARFDIVRYRRTG